jgi:hypothetical protein
MTWEENGARGTAGSPKREKEQQSVDQLPCQAWQWAKYSHSVHQDGFG